MISKKNHSQCHSERVRARNLFFLFPVLIIVILSLMTLQIAIVQAKNGKKTAKEKAEEKKQQEAEEKRIAEEIKKRIKELKDNNPNTRWYAADALGKLAQKAESEAAQALAERLSEKKESDEKVRKVSAAALGLYAVNKPDVVEKFIPDLAKALLEDGDVSVRTSAALALSNIPPDKLNKSVPQLMKALLHDEDVNVQHATAHVFKKMGVSAAMDPLKTLIEEWVTDLKSSDSKKQKEAVDNLNKLREKIISTHLTPEFNKFIYLTLEGSLQKEGITVPAVQTVCPRGDPEAFKEVEKFVKDFFAIRAKSYGFK